MLVVVEPFLHRSILRGFVSKIGADFLALLVVCRQQRLVCVLRVLQRLLLELVLLCDVVCTGNASVPSYAFNAGKQDGFNLDVVSLSIEKALAAREYDRIPSLMSDRWLSDCTLFGPAREVRAGIEAWQASGLKTLILVPSSTGGGQFEAVREVFALYE